MKYFAKLNANNHVIDANNLHDDEVPDEATGKAFLIQLTKHSFWKQYWQDGSGPTKNSATIGNDYDPGRDAFIEKQPWDSWTLNEEDCRWHPPVPYPQDGKRYRWNEETLSWEPPLYQPSDELDNI